MTQPTIPPVRDCGRYVPGHSVHWIQARLTWSQPVAHTAIEIVEVSDTQVVVAADGGLRRFWNHDLTRLRAIVARSGPHGALVGYHVLRLETGQLVCVKEDSEGLPDQCRADR